MPLPWIKSVFVFSFWFFFSSYQVWPSGCAWVLPWFLDGTNDTVRQPNSGFQDDFLISTVLFLLLGSTCRKNMTGFFFSVGVSFFLSSFVSLPQVSKPIPAYFQSNPFIYFFFQIWFMFFIVIYFILNYLYSWDFLLI